MNWLDSILWYTGAVSLAATAATMVMVIIFFLKDDDE